MLRSIKTGVNNRNACAMYNFKIHTKTQQCFKEFKNLFWNNLKCVLLIINYARHAAKSISVCVFLSLFSFFTLLRNYMQSFAPIKTEHQSMSYNATMFELHQTLVRNVKPAFKLTPQKFENISIEANILKINIILFCLELGKEK